VHQACRRRTNLRRRPSCALFLRRPCSMYRRRQIVVVQDSNAEKCYYNLRVSHSSFKHENH
jgi:hypothetical protein